MCSKYGVQYIPTIQLRKGEQLRNGKDVAAIVEQSNLG
jgi:hypothetical protein